MFKATYCVQVLWRFLSTGLGHGRHCWLSGWPAKVSAKYLVNSHASGMSYGLMKYELQGHSETLLCLCVELKAIHVLWLQINIQDSRPYVSKSGETTRLPGRRLHLVLPPASGSIIPARLQTNPYAQTLMRLHLQSSASHGFKLDFCFFKKISWSKLQTKIIATTGGQYSHGAKSIGIMDNVAPKKNTTQFLH